MCLVHSTPTFLIFSTLGYNPGSQVETKEKEQIFIMSLSTIEVLNNPKIFYVSVA